MGWEVLVVGHPRSGTSALAQRLERELGVDFLWGQPGLEGSYPEHLNPGGYKQRSDVHELCLAEGLYACVSPLPLQRQRRVVYKLLNLLGRLGLQAPGRLGIKEHGLLWVHEALLERLPSLRVFYTHRARVPTIRSCQRFAHHVFGAVVPGCRLAQEWEAYTREALRLGLGSEAQQGVTLWTADDRM